jgi:hypothetical protein
VGKKYMIMGTENAAVAPLAGQTVFAAAHVDAAAILKAAQNLIEKDGQ